MARPPKRRVRGQTNNRAAVASSAAPDLYVQLRGSPGISGGMILPKGSGFRKCKVPAPAHSIVRSRAVR